MSAKADLPVVHICRTKTSCNHAAHNFVLTAFQCRGAQWLSGRASDSGARGREFETYLRRVLSLSKTLYSPKALVHVIPRKRWLRPDMTENLLTGTKNLNTNKRNKALQCPDYGSEERDCWVIIMITNPCYFLPLHRTLL